MNSSWAPTHRSPRTRKVSYVSLRKIANPVIVALLTALCTLPLLAQHPLVTRAVDETARVTMRGNVHPLVTAANDLGAVDDGQSTGTMFLVLGRSVEQQAAFDAYVKSAAMPGTAQYRQWLTPEAIREKFGPAQSDIAAVTNWLEANSLKVESVSAAGNIVRFSGTMYSLRSAFGTEIHRYQVGNAIHLANSVEPSVPAALAPVVRGIVGLNDFRPQSQVVRGPRASRQGVSGSVAVSNGVNPELTVTNWTAWGPEHYDVFFLPAAGDAAILYDSPNTAMNKAYSGTTWTGSGVTIGIAGDSNLSAQAIQDIANYRSLFLNETFAQAKADPQLPKIVVDGSDPGTNGDELEALVDVEQAMAFAPQANTTLYTAQWTDLQQGLFLAMERAVDDNAMSILNVSFGECEQDLGAVGNAFINELYEQAAAQGITVLVSSGDSGAAGCDTAAFSMNQMTQGATAGLAVNGLASTPWNVAVGGTDFDVLYNTDLSVTQPYIQVQSSLTTSNEDLGTPPYLATALGYIPEQPWDDSSATFTTYAQNTPS